MSVNPEYLTEKEVSVRYKWPLPTLRNWRHAHKGPPYIKVGRSIRYKVADVDRFMAVHRINMPCNQMRHSRKTKESRDVD